VSDKNVIDMITFLLLILVIILELVVTFFNERRYQELCDEYKKKHNIIQNVWYVHGMKNYMMSVCQLIEKGF